MKYSTSAKKEKKKSNSASGSRTGTMQLGHQILLSTVKVGSHPTERKCCGPMAVVSSFLLSLELIAGRGEIGDEFILFHIIFASDENLFLSHIFIGHNEKSRK